MPHTPGLSRTSGILQSWYSNVGAAQADAVTAAMFLTGWFAPLAIDGLVSNLAVIMIVEFLLIHASGCYSLFILTGERSRRQTVTVLTAMSVFFLLFIVVWCLMFGQWWPLSVFCWLIVGKLQLFRTGQGERKDLLFNRMVVWGATGMLYILVIFLGLLLPVPEFGITAEVVPLLDMKADGDWMERPQTVVASGAVYFSMMAWAKFKVNAFGE